MTELRAQNDRVSATQGPFRADSGKLRPRQSALSNLPRQVPRSTEKDRAVRSSPCPRLA